MVEKLRRLIRRIKTPHPASATPNLPTFTYSVTYTTYSLADNEAQGNTTQLLEANYVVMDSQMVEFWANQVLVFAVDAEDVFTIRNVTQLDMDHKHG